MPERNEHLDEQLTAYLDGELTTDQRAEVDAWLQRDEQARARLAELRATVNAMKQLPRAEADDDLLESLRNRMERQALLDPADTPTQQDEIPVSMYRLTRWLSVAAVIALCGVSIYVILPHDDDNATNDGQRFALVTEEKTPNTQDTETAPLNSIAITPQGSTASDEKPDDSMVDDRENEPLSLGAGLAASSVAREAPPQGPRRAAKGKTDSKTVIGADADDELGTVTLYNESLHKPAVVTPRHLMTLDIVYESEADAKRMAQSVKQLTLDGAQGYFAYQSKIASVLEILKVSQHAGRTDMMLLLEDEQAGLDELLTSVQENAAKPLELSVVADLPEEEPEETNWSSSPDLWVVDTAKGAVAEEADGDGIRGSMRKLETAPESQPAANQAVAVEYEQTANAPTPQQSAQHKSWQAAVITTQPTATTTQPKTYTLRLYLQVTPQSHD